MESISLGTASSHAIECEHLVFQERKLGGVSRHDKFLISFSNTGEFFSLFSSPLSAISANFLILCVN